MNVRDVLLAVLVAVPAAGCHDDSCSEDAGEFAVNLYITPEQVDELVAQYGYPDRESITCEDACRFAHPATEGSYVSLSSIDICSWNLSADPTWGGDVVCQGKNAWECTEGRRPLGHVEAGDEACASPLGRTFAAMAYLEAASVDAFEQLAEALVDWAAPGQLVRRCRAAAADERHHARWLTALAARHGGRVPTPTRTHDVSTTRLALAEQNAREGCANETFAALVAGVRARHAPDRRLRQVFARIAADETRHAQLAWDLDAWFRSQLDASDCRRVEAARDRALARLPARALALTRLPAELGTVDELTARRLADDLRVRLAA